YSLLELLAFSSLWRPRAAKLSDAHGVKIKTLWCPDGLVVHHHSSNLSSLCIHVVIYVAL
ncbi:hypothetical protein, partial [Halorubellus sp. PRR65]|uniref:hypothetical protein n=1 Tax=Halorubellus sp. PRR65 TaxID=3098148 RepID=UPI002B2586C4